MATETAPQGETHRQAGTPDYDVLIIGAGLSGIGVARYLEHEHPERRYLILEQRERIGGTWDLFRYPGIRSDSDLHTYGYAFRPWTDEKAIADGPAILEYIEATARDEHVAGKIRFSSHVLGADFSRHSSLWTLTVESPDGPQQLTCRWLVAAAGYFRYDHGYLPEFPGYDRFQGTLVHPQQWPQDLDYRGKRIVVIGSGATAVTLAPALATSAAHVTMLQRTPTYVISLPERDWLANVLKRLLPARRAYALTRRKNIWLQRTVYELSRSHPKLLRRLLLRGVRRRLPRGFDIERHFSPDYNPWDQRLCSVPDGDLFESISDGSTSVVTDRIETFVEHGIRLESGATLQADIIVTATGLDLIALGGITLTVDGREVVLPEKMVYKSAMLEDVPNLALIVGYTNSSWTLKVDLVCQYLCRLFSYMDARGYRTATAVNDDPQMATGPLLDFGAGYVQRALDRFPLQGEGPWEIKMSYDADAARLADALDDGVLRFDTAA